MTYLSNIIHRTSNLSFVLFYSSFVCIAEQTQKTFSYSKRVVSGYCTERSSSGLIKVIFVMLKLNMGWR